MTKFLAILGAISLALASIIFLGVLWFFVSMPDANKLKQCLVTEMYKVHLCDRDPSFTQLEQISPYVIGAVLMSEDASFYSHDGIDMSEMKESLIKNLNQGRYARGGSTITQQLVKNVFLSGEKSILRKVQEIYLAFQVEKLFTKNRILTLYLNVVEFGQDLYGVGKASEYYFHKKPFQLSPEEGAFLAFLLPNPKKYSESFRKHQLTAFAYQSLHRILHKMLLGKKITPGEYEIAKANVSTLFGGSSKEMPTPTLDVEDDVFNFDQEPETVPEGN